MLTWTVIICVNHRVPPILSVADICWWWNGLNEGKLIRISFLNAPWVFRRCRNRERLLAKKSTVGIISTLSSRTSPPHSFCPSDHLSGSFASWPWLAIYSMFTLPVKLFQFPSVFWFPLQSSLYKLLIKGELFFFILTFKGWQGRFIRLP